MTQIVKIGNISTQIRGVSYSKSDVIANMQDGYLPVLRANNIQEQGLVLDDFVYVPESKISEKQRILAGDVIIAASSGSISLVGKAASAKENINAGFGAFCKILRPNTELVDPRYFANYFQTQKYRQIISNLAAGANINNLKNEHLDDLEIPLPPLSEQRRIAQILDKADELRQKRQQAIEKLDQLLQATFIEMFGDPVSNPKGWDLVKVGDVVDEFIGGKNIECPDERESKYKILKVSAVTSKVYKPDESKFAPNNFEPNPLAIVEQGDLLFSRANTTELVAATAYVWDTPENIVLPDKLWKFSISDDSKVNKLYLWDLFKNTEFRNELSKLSSGTSGSMKNISKGKLNEMLMPLPPKEQQDKFAETSTKLWEQIKTFRRSSASLNSLFKTLQNQAFSGNL
ncbi:restriction endonuclease subunit S [Acinetobacter towneri]|uniref:restriction endonuclease subunit S n=1 Tax=Acinetobacter TaxID=469 RepID=UPI0008084557|nr:MULTISPECIES: restriction endonuclease subunit S [Acinetobacter]MCA4778306.1 restriction endonuclease subunit S [Acinetobacter towneri]MCA4783602.1 restriction endonuclease subunit S [Acinetobacter towneri]MCA4787758.1 restriction endonuclease subunit S [Acinetobacter towneri]MCA4794972.1 restriction endonuclease subunit S [Acinetobacter towneri]MCA4799834.1 restriction endonuclease subunit S [Acinetobacter towneri]